MDATAEVQRLLSDKWWRMNHLYKIKTKAGEIRTFKPNYIQTKHIIERGTHKRNLILKARQFGITTLYALELLDTALWTSGVNCAILAHERETADRIFEIVKRAYTHLPDEIKPITKTDTKRAYDFTHSFDGSPLDSSMYVALKLRGGTVHKLHISESAYIKDRAELNAGSKQAVPMDGSISEETTANGYEDFYDTYTYFRTMKDNIKPLDYRTYFYAWHENPEYVIEGEPVNDKTPEEVELQAKYDLKDSQLAWYRWKEQELRKSNVGFGLNTKQLLKQEYPSDVQEAFQSGAGSVFDLERVDRIKETPTLTRIEGIKRWGEPVYLDTLQKFNSLYDLHVQFWELPEPDTDYVIGVDPSDGEGADFGVIDVWTKDTGKQVAQFYGKARPDELAEITAMMGYLYNEAFVGVENNMLATILFLSKIYDNYYYEVKVDERTNKRTKKIGWNTNTRTRDLMIDDFIIEFEESALTIRSPITINEMRTFIKNEEGKREHAVGRHDDALFAGFIARQMKRFWRAKTRVFAKNPF